MSELLATIPKLFAPRKDEYSRLVKSGDQLTGRAITTTLRQMNDAYLRVMADGKKTNDSSTNK